MEKEPIQEPISIWELNFKAIHIFPHLRGIGNLVEVNLVSTTANMEEEVNLEANLEVKVEASDYILGKIQKLQNIFPIHCSICTILLKVNKKSLRGTVEEI